MGYRDDAFFNLENIGEPKYSTKDNADFLYPSNRIRFMEAQAAVNKQYNESYKIKRGYIRGLEQPGLTGTDSTFTSLKCAFQFNPQTIQQVVIMSQSTYLPLLQDPYQFTQPMGSSTNFQFDLLFDRSREVAKGKPNPRPSDYINETDLENGVRYSEDRWDIGALADLQLLYSIIGQGFSKELIDFQTKRLAQAAITQLNSGDSSTDTSSSGSSILTNENSDSLARAAVEANFGNSAFILPAPVRVMFSTLFMVDGFVTGTTVDFLKFSTNMVPLQIRVGISMEAMYIGFAKKKTFLTDSLEKAGKQIEEDREQQKAAQLELGQALAKYMKSVSYGWSNASNWWKAVSNQASLDYSNSTDDVPVYLYELAFKNYTKNDRNFNIGFKDSANIDLQNTSPGVVALQGSGTRTDPDTGESIKSIFLDGEPTTLTLKWWFTVWGPYNTADELTPFVSNETTPSTKQVGNYAGIVTSADPWFWAKTFNKGQLTNANSGIPFDKDWTESTITNNYKNKFYLYKFKVEAIAERQTSLGPVQLTDGFTIIRRGSGTDKVFGTKGLSWNNLVYNESRNGPR